MKVFFTFFKSSKGLFLYFLLLLSLFACYSNAWAQTKGPDRNKYKGQYKLKQKGSALPKANLTKAQRDKAKFNFKSSELKGVKKQAKKSEPAADARVAALAANNEIAVSLSNPTSLQFGPDGRLYIAQQNGLLKVLTIVKNGPNDYAVTGEEVISLINGIPNHNDNGTLAANVTTRQVTSLLVAGTASIPIIYVSSSDSRIGGPSGDLNLDTNSGIISKLTKTSTGWDKTDIVRGLPRSEENHSNNGMQLDGNFLYVVMGGNTNAGAPSTNFAYTPEYALSTAVLSIDLVAIEALPTQGTGNNKYKYDLPTLDDPTRAGNPDAGDPFGGNDGLNQAKLVSGGPVQIFATGFRNAYDLVITKTLGKPKRMYVMDNGANQGWGGHPANEGVGTATNNYVTGEPGSTGSGPNDPVVNNLDNFHYIGDLSTYTPGSFYGGHPNPIRANPAGAGLYTHANGTGIWRTSTSGPSPLPVDWPPVPLSMAHPAEGNFQNPGETDNALLTFYTSTNGIVEYTASNFNSGLQGHILAASFDGSIQKISLTADGTDVTNARGAKKVNQDIPFASNFGAEPLDVTAQGDTDIFPGTIWAVCYLENAVFVFEPEENTTCNAVYSTSIDDDGDGYSNADEIDNASNPCSSASKPKDFDGDLVSDFNDTDDDNDAVKDDVDYFALDATNGISTTLPIEYEMFNNAPGTGLFGLGFTGLMLPKQTGIDHQDLYQEQNLIAGGAVGAFSVVSTSPGDPYQGLNNQENGFQFGVNVTSSTGPFTVQTRLLGPFFNNQLAQYWQSQGLYIGTGDQDNYLKIVVGADGGAGGIEILYENNGVASSSVYSLPGGMPMSTMDLYLSVNPSTGAVQPKYAKDGGQIIALGPAITVGGALLTAIQGSPALAVGILSTSLGATPFTATWDLIRVTADPVSTPTNFPPVLAPIGNKTVTVGQALTFTAQATDSNVPTQTLTYSVSGTAKATINATTGAFSWTPTAAGSFTFTIKVSDNGSPVLSDEEIITVTVNPSTSNQLPVANAGVDKSISLPTTSVDLTGSGIDTDGTITGYSWAQVSGPNTATMSSTTVASITVSNLIAGSYVFSLSVKDNQNASSTPDQVTVTVSNSGSSGSTTARFNSGGPAFAASGGRTFAADASFSAGSTYSVAATTAIANTTDDALYQTERYGNFSYNIPVGNGNYVVILHFAEIWFGVGGPGTRKFHVDIEGARKLTEYDIVAKAGGPLTAVQETFPVSVADGTLTVTFITGSSDSPKVSAIEVVPATSTGGATLAVSTSSLQFAAQNVNTTSAAQAVQLTNTGGSSLQVTGVSLSGANSSDFTHSFTAPVTVASGASTPVTITFTPTATGTRSAQLTITHTGTNAAQTVSLTGIGQSQNTCNWVTVNSSGTPRWVGPSVTINNKMYVFGGFDNPNTHQTANCEVYDPVTNTWSFLAPMPTPVTHAGITNDDAKVYIAGGFLGGDGSAFTNQLQIYDLATNSWSTGPTLPTVSGGNQLVRVGRKLHSFGGLLTDRVTGTGVHYVLNLDNPAAGWTTAASMPNPRNHFAGVNLAGKIYAIGGQTGHDGPVQDVALVHVYDPMTNTWTRLGDLPKPRSHFESATFTVDGKITIVGGRADKVNGGADFILDLVTEYQPSTDTWLDLTPLPVKLFGPSAEIIGNELIVAHGSLNMTANPQTTTYERCVVRTPNTQLGFSPATLALSASAGGNAGKQVLLWTINGNANYTIDATTVPSWLTVSAASGIAEPMSKELTVTANAAGLSSGTYTAQVKAKANGYSDATLQITFNVSGTGPKVLYLYGSKPPALHDMKLSDTGNFGMSQFKQALIEVGLDPIEALDASLTLTAATLNQYKVLLLGSNNRRFTAAEQAAVASWVNAGGGVVAWSDAAFGQNGAINSTEGATSDNDLTLQFGMQFLRDNGVGVFAMSQWAVNHYVNKFNMNAGMVVEAEGVSPIRTSSPATIIANLPAGQTLNSLDGPRTPADAAMAIAKVGQGRVAGFFDRNAFWNQGDGTWLSRVQNREFAQRLLLWASGVDDTPPAGTNLAPVLASIGNKTVTAGQNLSFTATATDANSGQALSYSLVNAPGTATINATTGAFSWTPTGAGSVSFIVRVSDNGSPVLTDEEQITVTVNAATPTNQAPVANAGTDKSLTLPANSVTLSGTASDPNGNATIASTVWTKQSGPAATMSGANSTTLSLTNLLQGSYVFRLTVTDNGSPALSHFDEATVVVNAATTNPPPTVDAGTDKAIALPTNSVILNGTASDPGGSIASYSWSKQSGPAATLTNANTATLTASGLVAGTYTFRLTATDNQGATAFDDVIVIVRQAVVSFTLIRADTDQELGLLTEGTVLNYASIGTNQLAVRANTSPSTVGSVVFKLDGVNIRTEGGAPYAIAGNTGSNYDPWTPSLGAHTLVATPYTASGGSGTAGAALTVNFSVINQSSVARIAIQPERALENENQLSVAPNPFERSASVRLLAKETGEATLLLLNTYGEKVKTIYAGNIEQGKAYEYLIEGSSLSKGVYILKLTLGKQVYFKKVILIR
jgi:hypothetical protein